MLLKIKRESTMKILSTLTKNLVDEVTMTKIARKASNYYVCVLHVPNSICHLDQRYPRSEHLGLKDTEASSLSPSLWWLMC